MLRSVKSQIILATSTIIIAVLGATAYFVIEQKIREINQDIFDKAFSFAELTHDRVIDNFQSNYQEQAFANFERDLAEVYSLNPDISHLSIYNYEGENLYRDPSDTDLKTPELERLQAVLPSVKTKALGRVVYLEKVGDQLRYTNFNGREVEPIRDTEQIENIIYPFRDADNITRNFSLNYEVSYDSLDERVRQTVTSIALIASLGILIALFIGYLVARGITAPIKALSLGAAQIGHGDLKTRIPIKSKTEVGMLAATFNNMAADLEKSTQAMIEHEKVAKELELAGKIQKQLLPTSIPQVPGLDIAASLQSATQVGGDCYDLIPIKKTGNLLFYIADVTGHGVGAGLVSAINNALIPALMSQYDDTQKLVVELNRLLKLKTSPSIFVTLVMAIWDTKKKILHFTQAGHDPILHYQAKEKKVVKLAHGGMALAMVADVSKVIKTEDVKTTKNDVFVLYTDGIPEAWKNDSETYGMDRLMASVEKHGHLETAQAIHDGILEDVRKFMGKFPQADDITLMVVKRTI